MKFSLRLLKTLNGHFLTGFSLLAVFFLALFQAAATTSLADDTYIFFRYARNLVDHGSLTWNPGVEMCNGFTSLLHTLYLSLLYYLKLPLVACSSITSLVSLALVFLLAIEISFLFHHPFKLTQLVLLFLALFPPLTFYVTRGFETLPYSAVFLATVFVTLRSLRNRGDLRIPYIFHFLLVLYRPEALLFATSSIGFLALIKWLNATRRSRSKILLDAFCFYVLPALLALSLVTAYYGYPVPNTFFAKNAGGRLGRLLNGIEYFSLALVGGGTALFVVSTLLFGRWQRLSLRTQYSLVVSFTFTLAVIIGGGDCHRLFRFFVPVVPLWAILTAHLFLSGHGIYRYVGMGAFLFSFIVATTISGKDQLFSSSRWEFAPFGLFNRIKEGVKNISLRRWPVLNDSFAPDSTPAISRYLTFSLPKNTTFAYGDIGSIGYYLDRIIYDTFGLNDKEIAHDPLFFPRHHNWGKLRFDILHRRNTDVFLGTKWGIAIPHEEFPIKAVAEAYFKTMQFQKDYEFTNLVGPFFTYIPAFVRKDSCLLQKMKTCAWPITELLSAIHHWSNAEIYCSIPLEKTIVEHQIARYDCAFSTEVTSDTTLLLIEKDHALLSRPDIKARFANIAAMRKFFFAKREVFIDRAVSSSVKETTVTAMGRLIIVPFGNRHLRYVPRAYELRLGEKIRASLDEFVAFGDQSSNNWLIVPARGLPSKIDVVSRNAVLARFEIPSRPVKPAEDETLPFDEIVCTNNPWLNWESATLAPNGQAYFEFEIGGPSKWWMLVSANPDCGNVEICVDWDNAAPPQTFTIKNSNRTPLYKHLALEPPLENHGKLGSCTITVRGNETDTRKVAFKRIYFTKPPNIEIER